MIPRAIACVLAVVCGQSAVAQSVVPCDWQASAQALAEPWEENAKTFSNGKVRLAILDTIEPAIGFAWLLVLSPPYSELGDRQCRVVGASEDIGFAGLFFDTLQSSYNPLTGLRFQIDARFYDAATDGLARRPLVVTLNQSTGAMTATYEKVTE